MRKFEEWVKSISPRLEFLLVILVAFGYVSICSLFALFAKSPRVLVTRESLIVLLLYESTVLLTLGRFLKKRGWFLAQFGARPSWKSTLMGTFLIPIVCVVYILIWMALILLLPELKIITHSKFVSISGTGLWVITLVSIINPVFEEIFVCGYIVHALKRSNSVWFAVIISTYIRTLYHLYQPIQGVVFITALGLTFGCFYAKTNRLWSVVTAHAIFDFYGLLSLNYS